MKASNKIALLISALVLLNGCSFLKQVPREVEIKTVQIRTQIQQPVLPRAIDMKEPKWYVVSNTNIDEFLSRIENETGGVFFAMTPGDYELMSYNLQEIKRFIKEIKEVIVYYRAVTLDDEITNSEGELSDGEQAARQE